jgi:hypothetical protein
MNTGKAIFLGLALIALAIFARDAIKPVNAGLPAPGRYIGGGAAGNISIWIVDTERGSGGHLPELCAMYRYCRASYALRATLIYKVLLRHMHEGRGLPIGQQAQVHDKQPMLLLGQDSSCGHQMSSFINDSLFAV